MTWTKFTLACVAAPDMRTSWAHSRYSRSSPSIDDRDRWTARSAVRRSCFTKSCVSAYGRQARLESRAHTRQGGLMAEQSVEVVKGLYEAFGRGDVPAVLGGMAEDIEWNEAEGMPQGGTYRGPG